MQEPQTPTPTEGAQGFQGSQGSQGFQGSQGSQGFQGSQGSQGFQGPQGEQNVPFSLSPNHFVPSAFSPSFYMRGAQGYQGAQGVQGAQTQTTHAPPKIASLEDLMNSREAIIVKEASDKATLNVLLNPTTETFKISLLQWASSGFQEGYTLYALNLIAPLVCSDALTRDIGGYILFLCGKSSEEIASSLQSLMPGIKVFHSFLNSSIRIHISKL